MLPANLFSPEEEEAACLVAALKDVIAGEKFRALHLDAATENVVETIIERKAEGWSREVLARALVYAVCALVKANDRERENS